MLPAPLARVLAPWRSHPARLDALEGNVSKQADAFAELDAQLDALTAYVNSDDETDAAQVTARADRIRVLLASVNPGDPTPAPGEPGAPAPVPPEQVGPDAPVETPTEG